MLKRFLFLFFAHLEELLLAGFGFLTYRVDQLSENWTKPFFGQLGPVRIFRHLSSPKCLKTGH